MLTESRLAEIAAHMRARDHLPDSTVWNDRQRWDAVHLELADDVPELLAEVQRLRQGLAGLRAILANIHQNSGPQPTKEQLDWTMDIIHKLTAPK